jgi:hypothetical protein
MFRPFVRSVAIIEMRVNVEWVYKRTQIIHTLPYHIYHTMQYEWLPVLVVLR